MSDWNFDKAALDRYIERDDDRDEDADDYDLREVECYQCGAKFDVPALVERPSYKCDECAERDMFDGDELSDRRE